MTRQRPHKSAKPQSRPASANQSGKRPGKQAGRASAEQETASAQRLQKVLAAAGVASRRDCEELIREGRVEVDRKVVTELGTKVDPVAQEIRVDGEPLRRPKLVYYALNKPMDIVCTNHDPSGRTRVIDLVPNDERVFAVGRLDRASEGLILVTNDGEFANHITHPRYGVEKTYLVRVAGRPGSAELAKLRRGVHLAEGFCKVESVVVKSRHKQSSDLLIVLDEGRNREIRRILAKVGHKVVRLKRIAVGDLKLGALEDGEWRKLTQHEVDALLAISRKKRKDKKKPPPRDAASTIEAADTEETIREEKPKKSAGKAPAKPAAKKDDAAPPSAKPQLPSAKSIADRVLAGEDIEFDDDDEDFEDELLGEDADEFDDDDDGFEELEDDDDDMVEQTVIREEVRDDHRPPRSGPAPRGDVIDFDEDSPPPLQSKKVREKKSFDPTNPRGDRPLRAEPRTSHRRRGDEQGRTGQSQRRGQRHRQEGSRQEEGFENRSGRPDRRPRSAAGGRNPRAEQRSNQRGGEQRPNQRSGEQRGEQRSAEDRTNKPLPKRPGKLVPARPQEDRGARGKYPGKSFGKGKKFEGGGGGRGARTIFGKRVKKKNRGRP